MIDISEEEWRHAFPIWLRTGKMPSFEKGDAVECKFNPWHDPADGRFTFAGSGRRHGVGEPDPACRAPGSRGRDNSKKPRIATAPKSQMSRTKEPAGFGKRTQGRGATGGQRIPAAEFVGGVGEGLYGVAKDTAEGGIRR
jgi:hypothetical protein